MRCRKNRADCTSVQTVESGRSAQMRSVRSSDPQAGDVTDGSVDYFDFEWGETVFHEECTMEPVLFPCPNSCADGCRGGAACRSESGTGCDGSGEGENGGSGTCADNSPAQNDAGLYEILQE